MMTIALVTDSTCNLPPALAAERHIYVAPLYVIWGEKSYKDGIDITEEELFDRLAKIGTKGTLPKTSQVAPQDFVTLFEQARAAENADEVVCAVLSSELSGTYASAVQAREIVDFPVHIVDTLQASWALGFPVLAGAEARDAGATPAEIVATIQQAAQHTKLLFMVESLDYLHAGGRIGGAARLVGTALNIKPILEVTNEGVINAADKVRTRKRAVGHLLKLAEQQAGGAAIRRLAVIHSGAPEDAEALLAQACEKLAPQDHYLSFITAVLGVHVGPGALGIIVNWTAG
jgi:DegV family protein with EDD domain